MSPYTANVFVCMSLIAVTLCSCIHDEGNVTVKDTKLLIYSDEAISFEYPDWPDVSPDDDEIFMLKSDGSSVFSAARYPVPSSLMIDEMEKNLGAVFNGEYGYYLLDADGNELNAITRVLYSDYGAYALTIAGTDQPDKSLLSSARRISRDLNIKEGIGIMPIPINGDASLLPEACREARNLGAEVISWYFFWGGLEDDWSVADYIMECLSHEGKSETVRGGASHAGGSSV